MQIAVPFFLPIPWLGSLESILRLDHPLMAYTLSPVLVALALAVGYAFRVTARAVAAASRRRVPRAIYGLAGLILIAVAIILARLAYAESHASGNAAISITFGFLAFYSTIGGVLSAGRSFVRGPKRLAFWVFLPHWILDSGRVETTPA
jgi:hypothetical protein